MVQEAVECYVCLEEIKGGQANARICECRTLHIHLECQRRVVKTSQSRQCSICRHEYTNVQFGHDCKPTPAAKWIAMLFGICTLLLGFCVYEFLLVHQDGVTGIWKHVGLFAGMFFALISFMGYVAVFHSLAKEKMLFEHSLRVVKRSKAPPRPIPPLPSLDDPMSV